MTVLKILSILEKMKSFGPYNCCTDKLAGYKSVLCFVNLDTSPKFTCITLSLIESVCSRILFSLFFFFSRILTIVRHQYHLPPPV